MSSFSKLFKLFVAVVLMPLVPMVLLLSYYQLHLKHNILETHVNLAEMASASLSQHIEDLTGRLSFAQKLTTPLNRHQNPTPLLKEALASNRDFLLLAVLSKDGKELFRAAQADALAQVPTLSFPPDTLPTLQPDMPLYVSRFEVEDGRPVSEFIYPLDNGDYLYGIINLLGVWTRIQEQRIGNTGHIYMVAQDGTVYAGPYYVKPDFNQTQLAEALRGGNPLISRLTTPQETYVGAFAPTPILGAYTVVLQLKKEAYRSIYYTNIILILFLLTIAAFSYFGALTFAEQLGEPITALSQAAREVSRGHLNVQVDEQLGWKEFQPLIAAFNQMVRDLKAYKALRVRAELAQLKENVFRAVAHDLRAPLIGLQGYIAALQRGTLSEQKHKQFLAQMSSSTQNLSLLLEDALALSRLQTGVAPVAHEEIDVQDLLDQVHHLLAPTAAEKHLNFTLHSEVDTLISDGKSLLRILTNLVSNAIKFTEKGFVRVKVQPFRKGYQITVSDSGIGMTPEEMKGLFKKFHQVNPTQNGYGLGLFISRQLVQALGGQLTVSSQKGVGTTFTVYLKKGKINKEGL